MENVFSKVDSLKGKQLQKFERGSNFKIKSPLSSRVLVGFFSLYMYILVH